MKLRIAELLNNPSPYLDKPIQLQGRVRTVRDLKDITFCELWDGSMLAGIQVVAEGDVASILSAASTGSVLKVEGILVNSPASGQGVEVQASAITVTGDCPSDYPLQKKRHTFEYLRTIAHLRPRTNAFHSVFFARSVLSHAIHRFFDSLGFIYVHTPIITGADAEGAGEMFTVTTLDANNIPCNENGKADYEEDFFGKHTHLTVSGQLNVEAFALAYGNCYTFGPTFRAENSNTARHASEFWMMEPEMAYCDLNGNMDNAEQMMKYCIDAMLTDAAEQMEFFDKFVEKGLIKRLCAVRDASFERISYTEAIDYLLKSGEPFEHPVSWGIDLQTEHERYLSEKIVKGPVFVTDYPKDIKTFYMRNNEDGKTVAAMDLLVPGVGEIIGGSQREERYDVLLARMQELGMDTKEYDWYLDLRRYGTIEHAGYGLGLERALMYMTGMQNIRDVLPYPRTPKNAAF